MTLHDYSGVGGWPDLSGQSGCQHSEQPHEKKAQPVIIFDTSARNLKQGRSVVEVASLLGRMQVAVEGWR